MSDFKCKIDKPSKFEAIILLSIQVGSQVNIQVKNEFI